MALRACQQGPASAEPAPLSRTPHCWKAPISLQRRADTDGLPPEKKEAKNAPPTQAQNRTVMAPQQQHATSPPAAVDGHVGVSSCNVPTHAKTKSKKNAAPRPPPYSAAALSSAATLKS